MVQMLINSQFPGTVPSGITGKVLSVSDFFNMLSSVQSGDFTNGSSASTDPGGMIEIMIDSPGVIEALPGFLENFSSGSSGGPDLYKIDFNSGEQKSFFLTKEEVTEIFSFLKNERKPGRENDDQNTGLIDGNQEPSENIFAFLVNGGCIKLKEGTGREITIKPVTNNNVPVSNDFIYFEEVKPAGNLYSGLTHFEKIKPSLYTKNLLRKSGSDNANISLKFSSSEVNLEIPLPSVVPSDSYNLKKSVINEFPGAAFDTASLEPGNTPDKLQQNIPQNPAGNNEQLNFSFKKEISGTLNPDDSSLNMNQKEEIKIESFKGDKKLNEIYGNNQLKNIPENPEPKNNIIESNQTFKTPEEKTGNSESVKIQHKTEVPQSQLKFNFDDNRSADSGEKTRKGNPGLQSNLKTPDKKLSLNQDEITYPKNINYDTQKAAVSDSEIKLKDNEEILQQVPEKNILSYKNQEHNIEGSFRDNYSRIELPGPQRVNETVHFRNYIKLVEEINLGKELYEIFSRNVNSSHVNETSNITLKLRPENLGELKISVDSADNNISASIKVDNEAAKQAVQGNIEQLKQSLVQNGIAFISVTVSLSTPDPGKNVKNPESRKKSSGSQEEKINPGQENESIKKLGYNTYEFLA